MSILTEILISSLFSLLLSSESKAGITEAEESEVQITVHDSNKPVSYSCTTYFMEKRVTKKSL